ncbi:hypothetical protein LTS18_006870, partial [Coniosporium uncinatum]
MSGFKYAFSLSKQEVREAHAPGTVALIDHVLVRTKSGHHDQQDDKIILVPEPSADPADPLNWPLWRKVMILFCMSYYAFLANFASASISSAIPILATPLGFGVPTISFSRLTQLISVSNLIIGAANIWWVPLANTFGRRPILLVALLCHLFFYVWCGEAQLAQNFDSLLVARLFAGMGAAPADAVAADVLGEVFFVHQRGRVLAIYTTTLVLGPLVGGLCGG